MEAHHRLPEQQRLIDLSSPVSVELDEEPIRARWDLDPRPQPQVEPFNAWRLAGPKAPILNSRHDSPLAALPVEQQRSLNQHERALGTQRGTHFQPLVVRSRA